MQNTVSIADEEVIDKLYDLWGRNDCYMKDEERAVELAQELYPTLDALELSGLFMDFIVDNPC